MTENPALTNEYEEISPLVPDWSGVDVEDAEPEDAGDAHDR